MATGNPIELQSTDATPTYSRLKGVSGAAYVVPCDAAGNPTGAALPGLSIPAHDEIVMSYSGGNISTVVYKADSVTVATLTMTYDLSGNLTSVVRT